MTPCQSRDPETRRNHDASQPSFLDDISLLGYIQAVQELRRGSVLGQLGIFVQESPHLSDILVPYFANLLNVCSTLGNAFERVALEDKLVFLRLGDLDIDTGLHRHPPDNLLADEVSAPRASAPPFKLPDALQKGDAYRISTSYRPVSLLLSMLTLMGKCA